MEVRVDNRESGLISLLSFAGSDIRIEPLDVGDVQIWVDGRAWLVFERKTHGDLMASLNSGRYVEQRERLKAWCASMSVPLSGLSYIIEGLDEKCARAVSCVNSIIAIHRIGVIRTSSLEDTARMLVGIIETIKKRLQKGTWPAATDTGVPDASAREQAVCAGVAYKKRANTVSATQCWIHQLCCVPGIAAGIAEKISQHYPDMVAFVDMLRTEGSSEAAIAKLCETVSGVGPKLAHKVVSLSIREF